MKALLICLFLSFIFCISAKPKILDKNYPFKINDQLFFNEGMSVIEYEEKIDEKPASLKEWISCFWNDLKNVRSDIREKEAQCLNRSFLTGEWKSNSPYLATIVLLFGLSTSLFICSWAMKASYRKVAQTLAGVITLGCFISLIFAQSDIEYLTIINNELEEIYLQFSIALS